MVGALGGKLTIVNVCDRLGGNPLNRQLGRENCNPAYLILCICIHVYIVKKITYKDLLCKLICKMMNS